MRKSVLLSIICFMTAAAAFGGAVDLKSVNDSTPVTVGLFSQIAEATLPSTVAITVHLKLTEEDRSELKRLRDFKEKPGEHRDDPDFGPLMERFFDPNYRQFEDYFDSPENIPLSIGAGVILDAEGHIITNKHVLGDEKQRGDVEVKLYDGRSFRGDQVEIVGQSGIIDIAVLKVTATGLKPARFGDSGKARIAEPVLALGHPLELVNSVSEGIISAKERDLKKGIMEKYLQTTAMINPGNSGGALVNMKGEVIGINVAIATSTRFWQGIGFAVPISRAIEVARNLIKSGREGFGYLGVRMIQDPPLDQRTQYLNFYGLKDGVVVDAPEKGGPAEKAGMRGDDIITEVDGVKVKDNADLIRGVAGRPIGDVITLSVSRPDATGKLQPLKIKATLGSRPSEKEITTAATQESTRGKLLGLSLTDAEPNGNPLGIEFEASPQGLKLTQVRPDSPAGKAGLQIGDVIFSVNHEKVAAAADLEKAMNVPDTRAHHLFQFKRQGAALWLMVEVSGKKKGK